MAMDHPVSAVEHPDIIDLEEWNADRPVSRVFRRVMEISAFFGDVIEETANEHGLQAGDFLVLMTLMRAGGPRGLRPTELYNELLVTSGAITKRIDRLQELGLVERVADSSDRRSSPVRLTAKGRKIGTAVRRSRNRMHDVGDAFGLENLERLDRLLKSYLKAVDETVSRAST